MHLLRLSAAITLLAMSLPGCVSHSGPPADAHAVDANTKKEYGTDTFEEVTGTTHRYAAYGPGHLFRLRAGKMSKSSKSGYGHPLTVNLLFVDTETLQERWAFEGIQQLILSRHQVSLLREDRERKQAHPIPTPEQPPLVGAEPPSQKTIERLQNERPSRDPRATQAILLLLIDTDTDGDGELTHRDQHTLSLIDPEGKRLTPLSALDPHGYQMLRQTEEGFVLAFEHKGRRLLGRFDYASWTFEKKITKELD